MTTEPLPFDGGATPEPPDTPRIGHRVTVKDTWLGDTVGVVSGTRQRHGITEYWIVWSDKRGVIGQTFVPVEMLEYVGPVRP